MSKKIITKELTEEELELVVGGQTRETYERFKVDIINRLNYEKLRKNEKQRRD